MRRSSVWLQVVIGWLPVWVLIATIIVEMHQPTSLASAAFAALRLMLAAAALGVGVARLCTRLPWPTPFRLSFLATHLLLALLYSAAWLLLNSVVESILRRAVVLNVGPGILAFLAMGMWLYSMVAGIAYATQASARAAEASAHATRAQLATLRAQLHPHFLFNALHIVVQLIPFAPDRAILAAEQVSDMLRTAIEEDRDLVPLVDEVAFVSRYLDLQRLRYGDRLLTHWDVDADAHDLLVPSFAVHAMVENAVRHGAEPNIDPTTISITVRVVAQSLSISVSDTGVGPQGDWQNSGTGLKCLRERVSVLYGSAADVQASAGPVRGFGVALTIPRMVADE